MGTDTNELRQDIERTRGELGRDVDALAEKVTPSRIAERRVASLRSATSGLRDRVMGSAEDVADSTGDVASSAVDAVRRGGRGAVRTAEGNPLAAGLLVFAAGWLVSSLVPVSEPERQLGGAVRDAVEDSGVAEQAMRMATDVKEGMAAEVRDSLEQVKQTASQAASTVTDQAREQLPS